MRQIFVAILYFVFALTSNVVQAQTSPQATASLPPGGAIVLGPFGPADKPVAVANSPTATIGRVFLSDGKTRIVFEAPGELDRSQDVTVSYKLVGDSESAAQRMTVVRVDPAFSVAKQSATAAALSWLFVLLIVALFIEGAVLAIVALTRLFWRKGADIKPTIYKPAYALGLSLVVVLGFPFDPLNDILNAFEGSQSTALLPELGSFVDPIVTALLLSGGAESVRRVAIGIQSGFRLPGAPQIDAEAEKAETTNTPPQT